MSMDLWSRKNGALRGLGRSPAPFGRRVRGFAAGRAEGLRKKVLKMDRPVGRKVQRFLAVPLRAHYKKAPIGIYQPKRHREADSKQR